MILLRAAENLSNDVQNSNETHETYNQNNNDLKCLILILSVHAEGHNSNINVE